MRILRTVLLVVTLFVLQLTVVPKMKIAGVTPDLMTVLLVALVLERQPAVAVLIGFVIGFLQDLGNASFLGMNALAKSLIAYGVSRFGAGFLPESVLFKGFIIFIARLANEIVVLIVTWGFAPARILTMLFRYSILSALYSALVGMVLIFLIEAMTGRMVGAHGAR